MFLLSAKEPTATPDQAIMPLSAAEFMYMQESVVGRMLTTCISNVQYRTIEKRGISYAYNNWDSFQQNRVCGVIICQKYYFLYLYGNVHFGVLNMHAVSLATSDGYAQRGSNSP